MSSVGKIKLSEKFKLAMIEYEYFADLVRQPNGMYLQLNSRLPLHGEWWEFGDDGDAAEIVLYKYESTGKRMRCATGDKERLLRLFAGKSSREWHLSEWRAGIIEGLFHFSEYTYLPRDIYLRLMRSVYGEYLPECVRRDTPALHSLPE